MPLWVARLTLLDYAKTVNLIYEKLDVAEPAAAELKKSNVVIHAEAKVQEISGDTGVKEISIGRWIKNTNIGRFYRTRRQGCYGISCPYRDPI